jgi:hypothetical protein
MISPPALALALAIFQSDVPLHVQGSVDVLPQAAFVQRRGGMVRRCLGFNLWVTRPLKNRLEKVANRLE